MSLTNTTVTQLKQQKTVESGISAKFVSDDKMSGKAFAVGLLTVLLVILATNHQAVAIECRRIPSVRYSINDLNYNTYVGGHVWQHIAGLTARPPYAYFRDTQIRKSLFNSWRDFKRAWYSTFRTNYNTQICENQPGTIADCFNTPFPIVSGGKTCTRVNWNNLCIAFRPLTIQSYIFVYRKVNGQWIMRTAYPSNRRC